MREFTRRQVAQAKSRRATPEELREAQERLKEIDAELRQRELAAETKHGEERLQRYERALRLRRMRADFQHRFPVKEARRPNSAMLALFMVVASFLLCAFFVGGAIGAYRLLNSKPDPVVTVNDFWSAMEQQDYSGIHENYLYPTLRAKLSQQDFVNVARQTDADYGKVTSATYAGESGDLTQNAVLTYTITRGTSVHYKVIVTLQVYAGQWGISDLGATFDPSQAGVPTSTPSPTLAPSATATSTTGG